MLISAGCRGGELPGGQRVRFEWNDKKAPWYWIVLAIIFVLTFFAWLGFDFIVPEIGTRVRDSHHSVAVSIFGGTYYIQRWAAWLHNSGGWFSGTLFVTLLLVELVKGKYVPRTR